MPKNIVKSPIIAGAAWYFIEKISRLIGAFLIGAWVARYLGPENYGALAYILALITMLGFLGSLGIESLVVRDLVEGKRNDRNILSTYFFIKLAGALLVPLIAVGYLIVSHASDHLLIQLALLCSSTVVFGAYDVADCWLQARNEAKATSVIRLIGFFGGVLSRCLLIINSASVQWFAVAIAIESAVIAILYFQLLHHNGLVPSIRCVSVAEFKHLVIDGKMMVFSGITVAIYSKIDVLLVGALLSKEAVGSYAMAASMCAAWNMVGMSLTQAWAPRISIAKSRSYNEYVKSMRQLLLTTLVISTAGAALLSLSAEVIFSVLLGVKYLHSAAVFKILVWSSIFVFLGIATSQIIINERIYWISMLRTMLGLIFCISVMFFGLSTWETTEFAFLMVFTSALATSTIIFSVKARSTIKHIIIS